MQDPWLLSHRGKLLRHHCRLPGLRKQPRKALRAPRAPGASPESTTPPRAPGASPESATPPRAPETTTGDGAAPCARSVTRPRVPEQTVQPVTGRPNSPSAAPTETAEPPIEALRRPSVAASGPSSGGRRPSPGRRHTSPRTRLRVARRCRSKAGRAVRPPSGEGRKSPRRVTNGAGFPSLTVAGSYLARLMRCDGCHRISFQKGWLYTLPTTGEFNMCNCTTRRGRPPGTPAPPGPGLRRAGRTTSHRGERAHRSPVGSQPDARFPVAGYGQETGSRRDPRPAARTKKIALDPAESSAIS